MSTPRTRSPRARVERIVGALALSATVPAFASAQIIPCAGVQEPGYKILLDDIVPASGTASPLMLPLLHRIDAGLEQLKLETGLQLRVVRCAKRLPGDVAEFRKPVVQDLTARQVLLEVWGTMAEVPEPGGGKYHEASIGYALVPVRFYEFGAADPPGAFLVARRAESVDSIDALLKLVDQAGALAAYAAVGAGTKLLKAREYDGARTQLCKAESLLAALSPKPGGPDASLLAYARRLAASAVEEARRDPAYDGPLEVLAVSASGCRAKP